MPTLKSIKQKIANDANKKNAKLPPKPHPFTKQQLESKKVTELRKIVREFNLHFAIKGYSSMRKTDLINELTSHGNKVNKKQLKPVEKPKKLPTKSELTIGKTHNSTKRKVDLTMFARRKAKTAVTHSFPKMQVIKEKRNEK